MGVRVAVCVQIKKILPEISWAMLAGGHGYRFNWLEPQVSTMHFCKLLILQNKFNWLKPVAQANEAVFSISQVSGVGYWKCASSSDAFRPCKSRNACATEVVAEVGQSKTMCVQMKKVLPEISRTILADGHGFSFNWLESVAQANEAVFYISQASGVGYRKCASSSDAFRPCKLRNACATEVVAEVGESETMCEQMKKVLPEIPRTMLADGDGFSFNWLESQVSTMNFCNLLILRNKFNWLKLVDQAKEAVFSISQASGVGYRKCASSAMHSGCANRAVRCNWRWRWCVRGSSDMRATEESSAWNFTSHACWQTRISF